MEQASPVQQNEENKVLHPGVQGWTALAARWKAEGWVIFPGIKFVKKSVSEEAFARHYQSSRGKIVRQTSKFVDTSSHQQSEGNPVSVSHRKWEEGLACSGPQRACSWWGGYRWSIHGCLQSGLPLTLRAEDGTLTPGKRAEGQWTWLPLTWAFAPHRLMRRTQSPSGAGGGP